MSDSQTVSTIRALADRTAVMIVDLANRPGGRQMVAQTLLVLVKEVADLERKECAHIAQINGNLMIAGGILKRKNLPEWQ